MMRLLPPLAGTPPARRAAVAAPLSRSVALAGLRLCGLALTSLSVLAGPVLAQQTSSAGPSGTETLTGAGVAAAHLPRDLSPWGMVASANPVVQLVIAGLALASVITWTVLLAKGVELILARRRIRVASRQLATARSLDEARERVGAESGAGPALIEAALTEVRLSADIGGDGLKERVASRLVRVEAASGRRIARGTGVLATIGATAPFVGLFGTVWGIMDSFIGISRSQTTNLAVVAPGIAEALLATAIGLVAAIPAVVIYNLFARGIGGYRADLADASAEIGRLVSRDLDRRALPMRRAAE